MIATETHPTPRRRRWQLFSTFLVMAQSMSDEDVVAVLMDLDLGRKLSGEELASIVHELLALKSCQSNKTKHLVTCKV